MEANIKRVLIKRAFSGHFIERRLVNEQTNKYKDVVQLYPEETELADDLAHACEFSQMNNPCAFGSFTKDPPSIWVVPMNVEFGKHWFQISAIEFRSDEIYYSLKSLRHFPGVAYSTKIASDYNQTSQIGGTLEEDLKAAFDFVSKNFNFRGLWSLLKFLVILLTTLITASFSLVNFLGDFTIKFSNELTRLIDVSMPFLLGLLEFGTKAVGGFYILLAMIWRTAVRKNQTPYTSGPAITYKR